jgi:hypothetical protein
MQLIPVDFQYLPFVVIKKFSVCRPHAQSPYPEKWCHFTHDLLCIIARCLILFGNMVQSLG